MLPLLTQNETESSRFMEASRADGTTKQSTFRELVAALLRFNLLIAWKRGKLRQILIPIVANIYLIALIRSRSPDETLPPAKFLNVFDPLRDCVPRGVSVSFLCDESTFVDCDGAYNRLLDGLASTKLVPSRLYDETEYQSTVRYDPMTIGVHFISPTQLELDMSTDKLELLSLPEESEGKTCRMLSDPSCTPVVFFRSCVAAVESSALSALTSDHAQEGGAFKYRIIPQRKSVLSGIASSSLAWIIPLYLSGLFLNLYNFALIELVSEKEGKHQDYLTGWGVSRLIHFLSWLISNCLFGLIAILVMLKGLTMSSVFSFENLPVLFFGFLSYFASLLSVAYLLAIRVTSVRTAANMASFTDMIFNITSLSVLAIRNRLWSIGLAIIPTVPFFLLVRSVAQVEARANPVFSVGACMFFSLTTTAIIVAVSVIVCIREHRALNETESALPSPDGEQIVTIKGLSKRYKNAEKDALSNVSLSLYKGEVHCLIGSNGAGKSTLMSSLLRIHSATSCSQFGVPKPDEMALCLQEDAVWESLTVRDHMDFFAGVLAKTPSAVLDDLASRLSLTEVMDQQCTTLSGGQRRRLSILLAVAKAHSPSTQLIILDEPTNAIDVEGRRVVWDLIKQVSREKAVLLTTHYLDEAQALSDRVTFLVEGQVRAAGTVSELQSSLNGGYLLTLERSVVNEDVREYLETSCSGLDVFRESQDEIIFRVSPGQEMDIITVLRQLEDNSVHFMFESMSLDNMFESIKKESETSGIESASVPFIDQDPISSKVEWKSQVWEMTRVRLLPRVTSLTSVFSNILFPILLISSSLFMRRFSFGGPTTAIASDVTYTDMNSLITAFNGTDGVLKVPILGEWTGMPLPPSFEPFTVRSTESMLDFLWDAREWYPFAVDFDSNEVWLNPTSPRSPLALLSFFHENSASVRIHTGTFLSEAAFNVVIKSSVTNIIIYVVISLAVISSQCATHIFDERKSLIKRLAQIQGQLPSAYWTGSALGHMLINLPVILMAPLVTIISVGPVISDVPYAWPILGVSAIVSSAQLVLFGYLFSLIFKSKESMLKFNSLYSLVFYELLVVGGVYLILTFYRLTFPKITFFMSLLVPPFHIAGVIAQLVALHMSSCSIVTGTCFWDKSVWEAGLWIPLFAGLIQIAAVLTLLTLMERRYFKRMRNPSIRDCAWILDQNTGDSVMHESVSSEINRIMKGCEDNVLFVKLWAHYPPEKTGKGNSEDPNAERQVKWAVRDLTLGVSKNETLSLLGKNGSGKTTSLSTLLGFQESTAGYAGIWPGKTVGFCPQVNALWDGLSGIDHIRFYASLRGCWAGRRYGEELLRSVGIDDFHKLTKSYSGGMKRRLCVAIAIVGSPDVLVMDEPTAGIDVGGKRHIWGILNSLRHRCSIIITTHSLEEADALSTRVSIMDRGRLVQIGTTLELKQSQRKMIVSFEPTLSDLALTTLTDSLAVPTQDVARTSESDVEVDLTTAKVSEIISVCLNMKHEGLVREFSLHHLSLEDVYLRAVET